MLERLGRYHRTLEPGLTLITPFIDRVRPMIDLREQVVNFKPQAVITEDNVVVAIETVLYFQITDARAATYEIASPLQAIEQLTVTTLRNVIGGLTLEQTLTSREGVNTELRTVLDEATGKWGIRVSRVEIKSVDPPADIKAAMEKQMRAERDRRAAILTAEGTKQAAILTAEGEKQAAVLTAEGAAPGRDPARRGRGEGDRDGVLGDPRRRRRPQAARLPVPADAAEAGRGRVQQGLRDPVASSRRPSPGSATRWRRPSVARRRRPTETAPPRRRRCPRLKRPSERPPGRPLTGDVRRALGEAPGDAVRDPRPRRAHRA